MLEKHNEKYLVKKVKSLGGRCYKWVSPGNRGVADRIAILLGQVWIIETKRQGESLDPLQDEFKRFVIQHTENYAVLTNKEEIDTWIAGLTKTNL